MDFLFGVFLALLSMLFWGLSDVLTKVSLSKSSKWLVLFLGQLFGAFIIFVLAFFLGELGNFFSYGLIYLLLISLVNFIGFFFFYKAIAKKGVALTSPIINSWAFITVILSIFFYNETISLVQAVAIILILFGIFLITFKKQEKIAFDSTFVFALLAMITFALFFFLLKIPIEIFGVLLVVLGVRLFTSILSVPFLVVKKINISNIKLFALLAILGVGLLDTFGFLAYSFSMNYAPVSIVAPIGSSVPIVSVILGVLVLKEKLNTRQKIGIITTIAGLLLLSLQ